MDPAKKERERGKDPSALVVEGREPVAQQRRVVERVVAEGEDGVVARELRRRRRANAAVGGGRGEEDVDGGEGGRGDQRGLHFGAAVDGGRADDED